jgi:hypothetical protein
VFYRGFTQGLPQALPQILQRLIWINIPTLFKEACDIGWRAWVFGASRGRVGARWRVGVGTLPRERTGVWPCRCIGCGIDVCGHVESLTCWHVSALASGCLAYLHCVLARGAWCMGTWAAVKVSCCSQQASCSDGVVERVNYYCSSIVLDAVQWLCSGGVIQF